MGLFKKTITRKLFGSDRATNAIQILLGVSAAFSLPAIKQIDNLNKKKVGAKESK